ncbi:unnamed protein product [Effrenium voratum]|uniref:non-specific serine/threonine protein kinase n=1 Tax=Effrenium voratum TaxID=2562239 RepID=A0AA36NN10_9DINO|nr:unnamed protein product [Effrenium voratum]
MAWLWGASCRFTVAGREVIQESLIADGGFAYVYRGRDAQTGEALAIRRALLQDAEAHQAAQLEMTLLLRLPHHDHVVRFLGADVVEGTGAPGPSKTQAVSLFELCTGGTLFARVEAVVERARAGPHMRYCCPCLPEAEALAALSGTASALHHLHAHRIIHYDVKSENLMLGSDGRWKLGDFGSASERSFDLQGAPRKLLLEAEAFVHGRCTPIFRAPEVADVHLRWPIGPKADMFSLGCVLFACLTGIHPFPMDSALANIQAKYHLPPESDAYSEVILRWLRQLLQREPQHRPDATTLARQVEAFVSGGSVPAEKVDVEAAVVEDWVADFSHTAIEKVLPRSRARRASRRGLLRPCLGSRSAARRRLQQMCQSAQGRNRKTMARCLIPRCRKSQTQSVTLETFLMMKHRIPFLECPTLAWRARCKQRLVSKSLARGGRFLACALLYARVTELASRSAGKELARKRG